MRTLLTVLAIIAICAGAIALGEGLAWLIIQIFHLITRLSN